MILLGIFWFGQAFSIYGAITRAAQEGARAGAAPNCTTCSGAGTLAQYESNAVSAVQNAMIASKLDPSQAQYPSSPLVFTACPGATSTTCSAASSKLCVQAPVLLKDSSSTNGVCGMSVSFQYPFQFWLPFTSLNKQKIWIMASARVRMENQ